METEFELLEDYLDDGHRGFMCGLSEKQRGNYRLSIYKSLGFAAHKLKIACDNFGKAIRESNGFEKWVAKK